MENNVFEENVENAQQSENVVVEETPIAAPEAPEAVAAPVVAKKGIMGKLAALPKRVWIIAAAVVVVIVAALFVYNAFTNNYKTPVKIMEDMANTKKITDYIEYITQPLNGFAEKEVCAIFDIMLKSDEAEESFENIADNYNESIDDMEEEYGSNYKYTYKIEDKEKLDKDELKEFKEEIKDLADGINEILEETEDYDSDDWEEMAEEIGLSKSQCKDLVDAFKDLKKALKNPKVEEGYALTVHVTLTGSEVDEPDEDEIEVYVYKVDGRWISESALSVISFLRFIG